MSGDSSVQFYLDGYRPGDPFIEQPHPSVAGPAGRPARGGRRPDRRLRAGRPGPRRAARRLPRDHDRGHRPPGRPARGGPGRRRRLPHGGDVRGVRAGRPAGRRGLLGQRGRLLAAGPGGPRRGSRGPGASRTSRTACRSSRTSSSTRRGCWPTCATPWRGPPAGSQPFYGLQAADSRSTPTARGAPGHRHPAAPGGLPGDRRDLHDPRQVRRRLRRRPQRRPDGDRPGAGRRPDEPVLGRHGRPGGHRLPRHPAQVRDPLGEPGQPADHPARGRLPGPALHRAGPGQRPRDARQPERHPGEARRGGEPGPAPVHARREGRRLVVGLRDRPAAVREVRRRARSRRPDARPRGCSSPATPATRTAPRPARA